MRSNRIKSLGILGIKSFGAGLLFPMGSRVIFFSVVDLRLSVHGFFDMASLSLPVFIIQDCSYDVQHVGITSQMELRNFQI